MPNNTHKILTTIYRYPVKSVTGEELENVDILSAGAEYDRRWMLVDENGLFLSQRKNPSMALINSRIKEGQLLLTIPGNREQLVGLGKENSWREIIVWNDQFKAQNISEEIDQKLSDFLQKKCHLVVMDKQHERKISDPAATGIVSFADGFPYLLIGSASLDFLNSKLPQSVDMLNFRPNLVVSTEVAHEEDTWDEIHVGQVIFKNVKPCSRCVLTTVDPKTGQRSKDMEPLKTLQNYRKSKSGEILFGSNLVALNAGKIYQGDTVKILSYKD